MGTPRNGVSAITGFMIASLNFHRIYQLNSAKDTIKRGVFPLN